MSNILDQNLTEDQKSLALKVLEELELDGMRVLFKEEVLYFIQDRRVVHVPLHLIESGSWSDIRFLFRAILGSAPPVWNSGAENTWGPKGPEYATKKN